MYFNVLVVVILFAEVNGHGLLVEPPARNSMWRYGFDTPKNYNDMGLNCGGFSVQWDKNSGNCLCGDPYHYSSPRDHDAGGKYAPVDRPISRCYNQADNVIDISVRITAHHKGYFEFRLIENNNLSLDPPLDVFENGRLLQIVGQSGRTRYDINNVEMEYYDFQLEMPSGVTCTQCILQWKYNAGNSWGCDSEGCGQGLGPQEQFINCADIAILPDCKDTSTTGKPTQEVTTSTAEITQPTQKVTTSSPVPKVIKLSMETSLKSQASDWLKWRPVAISANQMLEI